MSGADTGPSPRLREVLRQVGGGAVSDAGQAPGASGISRDTLASAVDGIIAALDAAGLAGARLCLPLSSSLGSLAALMAVMETGASGALVPMPAEGLDAATDWPAFCEAVLVPPDLGSDPGAGIAAGAAGGLRIMALPGGRRPRGEDLIYLRTSGTTGQPKWAAHDTARLLDNGRAVAERLALGPADRVMIPVPIHHMFGLGAGLLPTLVSGGRIHLVPRGNPLVFFQAERGLVPSVIFMVPSQCRSVMALGRGSGNARAIVVAGDRLFADEAQAFEARHGTLVALYGSTEMGAISASSPSDPASMRHGTAGPLMRGMTLEREPGDPDGVLPFRVRAENGLLGYVDRETGALLAPAPAVWATGDLVHLHEGARIEVLGRSDHAVKRDGLLVHMGQIEGCLAQAPGVDQAVAVSAGTSRRGAGLVAFCTLVRTGAGDRAAAQEAILAHARAALEARAVPDRLVILESLPMLASGKADRLALKGMADAG
ncbi:MAG: class I adenylate-forming enzyme family protein [Paracoccaceae bacterium]